MNRDQQHIIVDLYSDLSHAIILRNNTVIYTRSKPLSNYFVNCEWLKHNIHHTDTSWFLWREFVGKAEITTWHRFKYHRPWLNFMRNLCYHWQTACVWVDILQLLVKIFNYMLRYCPAQTDVWCRMSETIQFGFMLVPTLDRPCSKIARISSETYTTYNLLFTYFAASTQCCINMFSFWMGRAELLQKHTVCIIACSN